MTLCRVEHDKNNPYLSINTNISRDTNLSWKAKGIWFHAFSNKDDWQFYFKVLERQSTDGRESLRAGLKELENAGYLKRGYARNDKGKMDGQEWVFYETPRKVESKTSDYPSDGKPVTRETRQTENRPLTSIKEKLVIKELLPPTREADDQDGPKERKVRIVVVPSVCLNLGADEDSYSRLLKFYSEEAIAEACKVAVAQGAEVENFFGWMRDCIDKGWQPKLNAEAVTQKNKRMIADRWNRLDGMEKGGEKITVCNKYVEFLRGGVANMATYIEFSDPLFEGKMEAKIQELNERERGG